MSGLGLGAAISLVLLSILIILIFTFVARRPFIFSLAIKTLKGHYKMNMALLCATCVSAAVITGSLVAGDSLKESITNAVYENLGEVDEIVTSNGLFNSSIIERLENNIILMDSVDYISPLVHLNAIAQNIQTSATTRAANVLGIDSGFLNFGDLFASDGSKLIFSLQPNEILINQKLAQEIGVKKGDSLSIAFSNPDSVFEAIFHDEQKNNVINVVFIIKDVVKSESLGRFQLNANRNPPMNIYIPLESLNTALGVQDSINMILVSNYGDEREGANSCSRVSQILRNSLDDVLTIEDTKLTILENPDRGYVKLESEDIFFSYDYLELIQDSDIISLEASSPILTYFWNTLTFEDRMVAYSTVSAYDTEIDSPFGPFIDHRTRNEIKGDIEDDEIIINNWTAERLQADVGDTVFLNYSVIDEFYNIRYFTTPFTIKYVVNIEGKGNDSMLMPSFPGIEGKISPLDWDPPFPLDFDLITNDDEDYWDRYKGTPKGFITINFGQELWQTDIGNITQVRFLPRTGFDTSDLKDEIGEVLNQNIGVLEAGLIIKVVKQDALNSREGIEIFTQMFLAFSFACIISSAVLIILLITLRIESRAPEIGILRSLGFRKSAINNIYVLEGTIISILGGFLGVLFGLLFSIFLIGGMNTFWSSIVENADVSFSFSADSLLVGFTSGIFISVLTMILAFRHEGRRTIVGSIQRITQKRVNMRILVPPVVLLLMGIVSGVLPIIMDVSFQSDVGLILIGCLIPFLLFSVREFINVILGKKIDILIGFTVVIYTLLTMYLFSDDASLMVLFFLSGFLLLFGFLSIFYHLLRNIDPSHENGKETVSGFKGRSWLFKYAQKNAARSPKRTMFSVFLFSLTLFVLVSLTINLQGVLFDVDQALAESGGGYDIMGESTNPIFANLEDESSRENSGIENDIFDELEIQQFKIKGDVGGTCSNLNPNASPRIIGANESFFDSNSFAFVDHDDLEIGMSNPWWLLKEKPDSAKIPAVGDYNTIIWILGLDLGESISVIDENGETIYLKIVGIIENSIFPGSFIIWDEHFDSVYPSENGYNLFLFKSQDSDFKSQILRLEDALSDYGFDAFSVKSVVIENILIENTYISIFQVILILGFIIGTFGFGIVASRNALERRKEIGILRAIGFQRRIVLKAMFYEYSFIVIAGIVIGALSGIIAAGVYLMKLQSDILSWPWLYVLAILMTSFAVAMISAAIPILRSSKLQVSLAIKGPE